MIMMSMKGVVAFFLVAWFSGVNWSLLYAPPAMVKRDFVIPVQAGDPVSKEGRTRYWLRFPVRLIFPEMLAELETAGDPDRVVLILVEEKTGQAIYQRVSSGQIEERAMNRPEWLVRYEDGIKEAITQMQPPLSPGTRDRYLERLTERLWFDTTAGADFLAAANFFFVNPFPPQINNRSGLLVALENLPPGLYYAQDLGALGGVYQVGSGVRSLTGDIEVKAEKVVGKPGIFAAVSAETKASGNGDPFWRKTHIITIKSMYSMRFYVLAGSEGRQGTFRRPDLRDDAGNSKGCPGYDCSICMPPTTSVLSVDFSSPEVQAMLFEYVAKVERDRMGAKTGGGERDAALDFLSVLRRQEFEERQKEDGHLRGVVDALKQSNKLQFMQTWNNFLKDPEKRRAVADSFVPDDGALFMDLQKAQSGTLTAAQIELRERLRRDPVGDFAAGQRRVRRLTGVDDADAILVVFSDKKARAVVVNPVFKERTGIWWRVANNSDKLQTLLLKMFERFKCSYQELGDQQKRLFDAARRQLDHFRALADLYMAVERDEFGVVVSKQTKALMLEIRVTPIAERVDYPTLVVDDEAAPKPPLPPAPEGTSAAPAASADDSVPRSRQTPPVRPRPAAPPAAAPRTVPTAGHASPAAEKKVQQEGKAKPPAAKSGQVDELEMLKGQLKQLSDRLSELSAAAPAA